MAGFEIPEGWTVQAFRFAFNHMRGVVKANLDQRAAERSHGIAERDLTPPQGPVGAVHHWCYSR